MTNDNWLIAKEAMKNRKLNGEYAECISGFMAIYREYDGIAFAIWGTSHLKGRGAQRGFAESTEFWLQEVAEFLTDFDVFDEVASYHAGQEIVLVNEKRGYAFPVVLGRNDIYVKTVIDIDEREQLYVRDGDAVVAKGKNDVILSWEAARGIPLDFPIMNKPALEE